MPQPVTEGTGHLKFEMCPSKVFLQLALHVNVFKQVRVLRFMYFSGCVE